MIKKSIEHNLLLFLIECIKNTHYRKNFTNWNDLYLSWLFLKTSSEFIFSLEYVISAAVEYLDEEEIEHTIGENDEGSNLILPYTLDNSLLTINFLAPIYITASLNFEIPVFSLAQRMFFKVEILYRYLSYLMRRVIDTDENSTIHLGSELNQYNLDKLNIISEIFKPKVTLFFYNLNRGLFKKFLSLRQFLWVISTKATRTKRRYKKFYNFRLKKQNIISEHQFLFYVLRQLDILYSWDHLAILLNYNLIAVNGISNYLDKRFYQGDLIECCFGELLGEYQDTILYLTDKLKLWLQHKLQHDFTNSVRLFTSYDRVPYFIRLLPYIQLDTTISYTVDHTINTILITYIPVSINLLPISYYYNFSLFYLSIWRYNV